MTTPRTHDDGRNDKQRAQHARELEAEHERSTERDQRPGRQGVARTAEGEHEPLHKAEGEERTRLLEEKPYDFIERTKPEDRIDGGTRQGQQTRDNVNPNIPSVSPEELGPPERRIPNPGGIVDPKKLGMESTAGTPPPAAENQPEQWPSLGLDHTKHGEEQIQEAENRQRQAEEGSGGLGEKDRLPSINEPPGSKVHVGEDGPNELPGDGSALPPGTELPALVLTDIDPDRIPEQPDEITEVSLDVTGSGFTPATVVLFDDEEVSTSFVSPTQLTAQIPVGQGVGVYDVEVQRGDDLSDVLTFEIATAESGSGGARTADKAARKPKKAEPAHKRTKKDKPKSKR
jgi:hypothetical protein